MTVDAAGDLRLALEGRHQAVRDAGQWLVPNPQLLGTTEGEIAEEFAFFAAGLLGLVPDSPQLAHCLNVLTQAKDHAVRASLPSPLTPV